MKGKVISLAALALLASVASAQHNWHLSSSYDFQVDPSWGAPVTNIIATMRGGSADNSYGWGSTSWSFNSASTSNITLGFDTDWFDPYAAEPLLERSIMVGIVEDLPNDPPGQKHAVLFMDSEAAARINNIAWGTIFTNTLEDRLIYAIEEATSGGSWEYIQPFFDEINDFLNNDASFGNLGPNGTPGSAWFGPGQDFSIVAWSDAKIIGSGSNSWETRFEPVPEPGTIAALGLGLLVLLKRRRKLD